MFERYSRALGRRLWHRESHAPCGARTASRLLATAAIALAAQGQVSAEPERFFPEDLGQDGRITLSPGFSPDGGFLVLAQSECGEIGPCPQRLKLSMRTEQGWSAPQIVGRTAKGRVDWPSIAPDGRTVLFSFAQPRARHEGRNVYEDFDLHRMDLRQEIASPIPLDEPDINRIRGGTVRTLRFVNNETAPVLTKNGDLYFWSERLDGPGERDIYVARADDQGGFLAPQALPSPINSAGREDNSWVTPDGSLLFLSLSDREDGGGRSDIYFSKAKPGGQWSEPKPLGPAVNSPYDDIAARLTPDGRRIVFTSTRPFGDQPPGLFQVWTVPVKEVDALRTSAPDR